MEQAKIITEEANKNNMLPTRPIELTKEMLEEKVGSNGAVVTTAQELRNAISANKEIICVYGEIDYFENEAITLRTGQKLVGTEYYTGYTGTEKLSKINQPS